MSLRIRFLLLMTGIFCGFVFLTWMLSDQVMTRINEKWGEQFVERQVMFDKYRTLSPLIREISLARKMAADPDILQMALHEDDPIVVQKGIAAMEKYRFNFRDHSYFAAMASSGNYYFNDAEDKYKGKQLRYVLSRHNPNDKWFYQTLTDNKNYQINLDPDVHLGVTKVWINVLIKNEKNTIGIIGTGIDLTDFLKETVSISQKGVHNLFIDRNMAIQLHDNSKLIDYMSLAKDADKRIKINTLLTIPADLEQLRLEMDKLEVTPNETRTLWVEFEGQKHLLGLAFLPEVGWYDLTLIDTQSLALIDNHNLVPALLAAALLIALLLMGQALRRWVLKPISALQQSTDKIQQGDFNIDTPVFDTDEIGHLSRSFADMANHVRASNQDLENKVQERTAELTRSEAQLRSNLENTPNVAIQWFDESGIVIYWNHASELIYGWTSAEAIGKPLDELMLSPALNIQFVATLKSIQKTGKPFGPNEFEFHTRDGKSGWVISTIFMIPLENEKIGYACMDVDISARKLAEIELRIAAIAFESQEGIIISDANKSILRVNRAFTDITGYEAHEAIGKTPHLLQSGRHDAEFYVAMWANIGQTGAWQGEIWNRRKNGEIYPAQLTITAVKEDQKEITHYVATLSDITLRKASEAQIHTFAYFDALTKLPNRRLLNDRLRQFMANCKRSGHYGAIMFMDLDNFKPLNDTYGHSVGDLLLVEAAQRISGCVRETDTVARFGGDEFVVILSELSRIRSESAEQASHIAEKIRLALSEPYQLTLHHKDQEDSLIEHTCTSSIGVTLFDGHESTYKDILQTADMAMYQAKESGRNRIVIQLQDGTLTEPEQEPAILRFNWSNAYFSGNNTIDQEHRELFDLANVLIEASLSHDTNPAGLNHAMDNLIAHVARHFADEEVILAQYHYPQLKEHAQAHQALIARALQLRSLMNEGYVKMGDTINFLAYDVVAKHMLQTDRKFFALLQKSPPPSEKS